MASGPVLCDVGDGFLGAEREVILRTGSELSRLAGVDPAGLSREELADLVVSLTSAAESVSVMAGRYMGQGEAVAASLTKGEKSMVALVSSGSRVSRRRAQQLKRAGTIGYRFPHFHEALMEGRITTGHIDVLVGAAKLADSMSLAAAERALAALAVLCTPEEFREKLAEWVAAADPIEHLDQFLREQAKRHFCYGKDLFGNIHFSGTFEPVTGEQMINSIHDRQAELVARGGSVTSAGTVDALVDLVLGDKNGAANLEVICAQPDTLTIDDAEPEQVVVPEGQVVHDANEADIASQQADQFRCVEADTFLHWHRYMYGSRDNLCPPVPTIGDTGFGSIIYPRTAGGTLIPPTIVAKLARKGRVRRHMIDTDGNLTRDVAGGRRFTAVQKRMIRLRDSHCQHPGCRTPIRSCDYDHTDPHHNGGPSLTSNGQTLCRFHHRYKHRNDHKGSRLYDNTPVIQGPNPPQQE